MARIMFKLLRRVLRIPPPLITAEQAARVARAECERRGWRWGEATVVEELRHWLIWADSTRPAPLVVVDQRDGKVVRSGCGLR